MPSHAVAFAVLLLATQSPGTAAQVSSLDRLAAMEAPIGHRQPTLNDLPPWLRKEETGTTGSQPADGGRPGTERLQRRDQDPADDSRSLSPATGVPQICQDC